MKNNQQYASLLYRFFSFIIDTIITFTLQVFIVVYLAISQATSFEDFIIKLILYWLIAVSLLLLPGLYLYMYCIERWGGSPGKIISGLYIIDSQGKFLSKKDALFREMVYKPISYAPFGFGILSALKNDKKQTWHDEMARTYVVQKENKLVMSLIVAVCLVAAAIYACVALYNLGTAQNLF